MEVHDQLHTLVSLLPEKNKKPGNRELDGSLSQFRDDRNKKIPYPCQKSNTGHPA
jgi:hypothetical protein